MISFERRHRWSENKKLRRGGSKYKLISALPLTARNIHSVRSMAASIANAVRSWSSSKSRDWIRSIVRSLAAIAKNIPTTIAANDDTTTTTQSIAAEWRLMDQSLLSHSLIPPDGESNSYLCGFGLPNWMM